MPVVASCKFVVPLFCLVTLLMMATAQAEEEPPTESYRSCLTSEFRTAALDDTWEKAPWFVAAAYERRADLLDEGVNFTPVDPAKLGIDVDLSSNVFLAFSEFNSNFVMLADEERCGCAPAQATLQLLIDQSGYYSDVGAVPAAEDGSVSYLTDKFYSEMASCRAIAFAGPYTIYFDPTNATLTDSAKSLIEEIGETQASGQVIYSVRGYTDTFGSFPDNMALGQRRANAVSSALQSAGIGVAASTTAGESELAISTGDGAREPLNARVTLTAEFQLPVSRAAMSSTLNRRFCVPDAPPLPLSVSFETLNGFIARSPHVGEPRYHRIENGYFIEVGGKTISHKGHVLSEKQIESYLANIGNPYFFRLLFLVANKSPDQGGATISHEYDYDIEIDDVGFTSSQAVFNDLSEDDFTAKHHCTAYVYFFSYRPSNSIHRYAPALDAIDLAKNLREMKVEELLNRSEICTQSALPCAHQGENDG